MRRHMDLAEGADVCGGDSSDHRAMEERNNILADTMTSRSRSSSAAGGRKHTRREREMPKV